KGRSRPMDKYGLPLRFACGGHYHRPSAPEVLEPRRGQFGVADRVADRLVTQVRLQPPRIDPIIGKRKAPGMAQHVRMDRKAEFGGLTSALDRPQEPRGAER